MMKRIVLAVLTILFVSSVYAEAAPIVVNGPSSGKTVQIKRGIVKLHKRKHKHRRHKHKKKTTATQVSPAPATPAA